MLFPVHYETVFTHTGQKYKGNYTYRPISDGFTRPGGWRVFADFQNVDALPLSVQGQNVPRLPPPRRAFRTPSSCV
jgi:hypothetical protein